MEIIKNHVLNASGMDNKEPMKQQLLELLEKVRKAEILIEKILADDPENNESLYNLRTSAAAREPLSLFIQDCDQLKQFIQRLQACETSKEWALQAVYPLYENGDITAEVAKSKRFIELTIPYCINLSTKNCNTLAKQLRKYCYFPR